MHKRVVATIFPYIPKRETLTHPLRFPEHWLRIPAFSVDRVYVSTAVRDEAKRWVAKNRHKIIVGATGEEESNGTASKS